jgi:hypothetical protein
MTFRHATGDLIRGGGTATLIEGRSTTSGISRVELLDEAESTFALRLGLSIRREIEDECQRVNEIARSQIGTEGETGGYLFSHYSPRAEGVTIVHASADGVKHTTHSVALEDPVDAKRSGLKLCGNWHSHGSSSDPRPSINDLNNWAEHLRRSGLDSFASLIVTPGSELGWMIPRLHAYRTYWDPAEPWGTKPVCTPARIVE